MMRLLAPFAVIAGLTWAAPAAAYTVVSGTPVTVLNPTNNNDTCRGGAASCLGLGDATLFIESPVLIDRTWSYRSDWVRMRFDFRHSQTTDQDETLFIRFVHNGTTYDHDFFADADDHTFHVAAAAFYVRDLGSGPVDVYVGSRTATGVVLGDFYNLSPTAVPEPATWAMMVAGFGLAGAALRRPRSTRYYRSARRDS